MKNLVALLTILSMVVTPCLAQCVNETVALLSNQAIDDANSEMEDMVYNAIIADPTSFCKFTSATCTIDLQDFSSNLDSNCTALGGQLAERTIVATCNGTVQSIPLNSFTITNVPLCVGASCNATSLPSELEDNIKMISDVIVEDVNSGLGANLDCYVTIDNGGGNGGGTTPAPNTGGGGTSPTPAPNAGGGGTSPTPAPNTGGGGTSPTSGGVQSATILVTAAGVTLLSFVLM